MKLNHELIWTSGIDHTRQKIINELFKNSFSQDLPSINYFRWKYRENPFGDSLHLLTSCDGTWVASRAFWRIGGEKCDLQCVDTCVSPKFQGKGIFAETTKFALSNIDGHFYNLPNNKSLLQYKKYGWKVNNFLKPRIGLFKNFSYHIPEINLSEAALRWRYEQHPFFKYKILKSKGYTYIFRIKRHVPILLGKCQCEINLETLRLNTGFCVCYSTFPGIGIEFGSVGTVISNNYNYEPIDAYWFDMF